MSNNATITRTKRTPVNPEKIVNALGLFNFRTEAGFFMSLGPTSLTNIITRLLSVNGEITRQYVGARITDEVRTVTLFDYDRNRVADNFLRQLKARGIATFNRETKTWTLA